MPKAQRTCTQEFKREAVLLAQTSGKSLTQVAKDLGIADSTLSPWCQRSQQHGEEAFPGSGHQTPQEEELRRLKRVLAIMREDRGIFKRP